jgi:hypothetical protein
MDQDIMCNIVENERLRKLIWTTTTVGVYVKIYLDTCQYRI